jgi:hypothetical protein
LTIAAVTLRNLRVDQLPAMRFEAFVRAVLVRPHQARVASHIGDADCGG